MLELLQKDSLYIELLRASVGILDGCESGILLPKGICEVVVKGVEGERALLVWELDEEHVVFTLLARTREAKGLEPVMVDEVRTQPDWSWWEEASNAELKGLADVHTWDMMEQPKGTNIICCKWIFKIKKNTTGEIDKYKA